MLLYRICPEIHLENYSGFGASYTDGARWNLPGIPVIYFGSSSAVAMLELVNYLPSPHLVPSNYRFGIYQLPDDVKYDVLDETKLSEDWNKFPYPLSTQKIGSEWLLNYSSTALIVPSAAVPGGLDKNIVFNPKHSDAGKIKLVRVMDKIFSERMFSAFLK